MRKVNRKALDSAYTEVVPYSTPINVNKKKRVENQPSSPSPSTVTAGDVNKKKREPP